jgi:transcriptional regulator of acetoin/glycerol metabolism
MLSTSCYLRTWERFVSEGVLDSNRLNKRIMESWHRCKKDQVNPYLNKGKHILTDELLDIQREKNSFLIEVASPQLWLYWSIRMDMSFHFPETRKSSMRQEK